MSTLLVFKLVDAWESPGDLVKTLVLTQRSGSRILFPDSVFTNGEAAGP